VFLFCLFIFIFRAPNFRHCCIVCIPFCFAVVFESLSCLFVLFCFVLLF
jgi:hypothetical protein